MSDRPSHPLTDPAATAPPEAAASTSAPTHDQAAPAAAVDAEAATALSAEVAPAAGAEGASTISASAVGSERPALRLSPLTARVLDGARRMGNAAAWAHRVGAPRILPERAPLETPVRELATLDADPDHMTALHFGDDPRPLGRPNWLEDELTRITPQFFLRNTRRMERHADLRLSEWEYNILRDLDWQADLEAARDLSRGERPINAPTGRDALDEQVALRRKLVVDTPWHQNFGRREPSGST